jgi:hypothetical protein
MCLAGGYFVCLEGLKLNRCMQTSATQKKKTPKPKPFVYRRCCGAASRIPLAVFEKTPPADQNSLRRIEVDKPLAIKPDWSQRFQLETTPREDFVFSGHLVCVRQLDSKAIEVECDYIRIVPRRWPASDTD